ncbi:MAG: regulatory iron-sulfur-containing complex subunit RicT [Edaphocola sp.]
MGCGSCGTASGTGKPSGCQSNGGCSTGGCNRLNVFNWLSDIPFSDPGKPYAVAEVSFNKGSRKEFFRNVSGELFEKGDWVAVEGAGGFDVGQISLTGELVKLQMKKYAVDDGPELKKLLRPATERDMEQWQQAKERERETTVRARAIAKELRLEMKIAEVEFQADSRKVTFFYTADSRVDFRELIKIFATEFKAKVEMRQIGARQESGKVGGIGSCGRELCCSTWLSDFKTVNTTAARYQSLSINQTKLSGQCGRLKCCLNYELDTYMDALQAFPEGTDQLEVAAGRIFLQKKDIFRNLMWYSFSGSNKQYPLTKERVLAIKALNQQGVKPEDLEAAEVTTRHKDPEKTVDMGFVNDVGLLTLSSLSKGKKKNKQKPQQKQRTATAQEAETQTANRPAGNNRHNAPQHDRKAQQGRPQQGNRPSPNAAARQAVNQDPATARPAPNNTAPRREAGAQQGQQRRNNPKPNRPKEQAKGDGNPKEPQ